MDAGALFCKLRDFKVPGTYPDNATLRKRYALLKPAREGVNTEKNQAYLTWWGDPSGRPVGGVQSGNGTICSCLSPFKLIDFPGVKPGITVPT